MVVITRKRTGKKEFKGESISEFKARQRKRLAASRSASIARRSGFKGRAMQLERQAKALQVTPTAQPLGSSSFLIKVEKPKQFELKTQSGRVVASGSKLDITRFKALQSRLKKSTPKATTTFIEGVPSGEIIGRQVLAAKSRTIPQRQKFLVVENLLTVPKQDFSKDIIDRKLLEQRRRIAKRRGEELSRKDIAGLKRQTQKKKEMQEKAIAKVEAIDKKVIGFNENLNKFINKSLDKLRFSEKGFVGERVRLTTPKLFKFLNPIILTTELSAEATKFKILRDAGLTSVSKVVKGGVKGTKNLTVNDVKILINKLQKNLDPTTPEGFSNLFTLGAVFGVGGTGLFVLKKSVGGAKIGTKATADLVAKAGISADKFIKANKLLASKAGKASFSISAKKSKRLVSRAKKTPSKAEFRKRVQAGKVQQLTAQQKLFGAKTPKQLRLEGSTKEIETLLQKTKPSKAPAIGQIQKGRFTKATAREKLAVSRIAKLEQRGVILGSKPSPQVFSRANAKATRTINTKAEQHLRSGRLVLLTKQKNILLPKRVTTKTKTLKLKLRKELIQRKSERFLPTTNQVTKDLTPEKLYPGLIVPSTGIATKGWRSGTKQVVLASIMKKQKILELEKAKVSQNLKKRIDSVLKKEYKTLSKRNEIKSKLLSESLKPGFDTKDIKKIIINKQSANKLNKEFKALSLINFRFDVNKKIINDVSSIPISKKKAISKAKEDIILDKIIKTKEKEPRRKRVVRKPLKIKKPVPPKFVKEPKKTKKVLKPTIRRLLRRTGIKKPPFKPKLFIPLIPKAKKKTIKKKETKKTKEELLLTPTITTFDDFFPKKGKKKKKIVKRKKRKFTGLEFRN